MSKALAGIFLVLALVLGFQFTYGLHSELQETRDNLVSFQDSVTSQPPVFRPFELAQANGDSVLLSDYKDDDILLVYIYSDSTRNTATEADLADIVAQNPDRVSVLSVRTAAAPDSPTAAKLTSLGDTADDEGGQLMQMYDVTELPSVVVLKNRPIHHATFAAANGGVQVEASVDAVLEGEDLVPPPAGEGGGGGGCGSGGGCGGPGGGMAMEGSDGGCGTGEATTDGDSCPATEMIERTGEDA